MPRRKATLALANASGYDFLSYPAIRIPNSTAMADSISIPPATKPIRTTVRPPGSKSISNRALVCAAMAKGTSTLDGVLDSEDTAVMIAGLRAMGIGIDQTGRSRHNQTLAVCGCGGKLPYGDAQLFVEGSGTTMRFLTALATLGSSSYRLDGIPRMRERPIADLVEALEQIGATIQYEADEGCPPVVVRAAGLAGGQVHIKGDISSQFLSGLLMAAPYARDEVTVMVDGPLVSVPYVQMTLQVMKAFGVEAVAADDLRTIRLPSGSGYQSRAYPIEPDASAASYFFAMAAVTGGEVTVEGLSRNSLQGDVAFCDALAEMGCEVHYDESSITVKGNPLKAVNVDMNAISDTVQTLSVVALFAEGTTRIRHVEHIRHKETDRIAAVANELRKLGASVVEHPDGLEITPSALHGATIDTYNDHRMAMSFALAGLRIPGVVIKDPGCTQKTYPKFFDDLQALL